MLHIWLQNILLKLVRFHRDNVQVQLDQISIYLHK